jgi:hypothetical protein
MYCELVRLENEAAVGYLKVLSDNKLHTRWMGVSDSNQVTLNTSQKYYHLP